MYWHRVKQLDMNPFIQPSQLPYHFTNEETQAQRGQQLPEDSQLLEEAGEEAVCLQAPCS